MNHDQQRRHLPAVFREEPQQWMPVLAFAFGALRLALALTALVLWLRLHHVFQGNSESETALIPPVKIDRP
jgi:hypothetical protein